MDLYSCSVSMEIVHRLGDKWSYLLLLKYKQIQTKEVIKLERLCSTRIWNGKIFLTFKISIQSYDFYLVLNTSVWHKVVERCYMKIKQEVITRQWYFIVLKISIKTPSVVNLFTLFKISYGHHFKVIFQMNVHILGWGCCQHHSVSTG